MATTKSEVKTPRTPKAPVSLHDRVKSQLSQATLKGKISLDELTALSAHIDKLKSILS